jgi:hypothetical protein
MPVASVPEQSIYPGFDHRRFAVGETTAGVRIPKRSLERLTQKICRGIFWIADRKFVEPPYRISFYAMHEAAATPIVELLREFGREYARGPGLTVWRASANDHAWESMFSIEVWGQLKMYAYVSDEGDE